MKAATSSEQSQAKRPPAALRESRPRKREKYTRMACSLCKVRKVKCSGDQPCYRCEELHSECTYNDPSQPETDITNPQSTQQELELTVLRMNRICEQIQQSMGRSGPAHSRQPYPQRRHRNNVQIHPGRLLSPTDFRYILNLTRDAMRAKGLRSPPGSKADGLSSVAREEVKSPDVLITLLQAVRPILELGHEKATELFMIFKHEIYPLYPCVSLEMAPEVINAVFSLMNNTSHEVTYNLDIIDVEILKSVLAIALLVKGDTKSPLASDLEGQLVWNVDACFDQEQPQIEDIIMATLLSIYLDLNHRSVKAWRMSGVAAKLCLELGIHREKFFEDAKMPPQQVTECKRLFACVYNADKKCSFYSGLPWTLHDRDIDLSALIIEPKESFLSTMISLDRNLSETWNIINAPSSASGGNSERIEFLEFQLQKLIDNIPAEDFTTIEPTVASPPWLRTGLKWFCRLRVNHIKMLTHIGTSGSIRDVIYQPKSAKALVILATDSVDLYLEMMKAGEISPLVLPSAIKFLLASLSVMVFTVSHCAEDYGPLSSKPFYNALDILSGVQDCIEDPDINIWKTLEELEKIAQTIQMSPSKRSGPLISRKEGTDNPVYNGEPFGEGYVLDGLRTPDSEFLSMLGDVSMAATDMLYVDSVFD
ncbi:hypothetical protein BGW36DRAFT_368177 [Talaromyces proteolyticus]|uniref:Zn(2)-C6 fungal-type domain-containing protein n=1 Tax=Talaromyces proteolyticus TaxID=1131652 RepID=A0AAD4Q1L9_9EURO|nr:uncharacterized protein BGW36DRAFT_368177 [Talaromyces proteolyticus]KAH8705790.1 hypothetical protein BGW36DRAFT_368177 [Talaromyces proteolyticus]